MDNGLLAMMLTTTRVIDDVKFEAVCGTLPPQPSTAATVNWWMRVSVINSTTRVSV
jgi:hypothetical protein